MHGTFWDGVDWAPDGKSFLSLSSHFCPSSAGQHGNENMSQINSVASRKRERTPRGKRRIRERRDRVRRERAPRERGREESKNPKGRIRKETGFRRTPPRSACRRRVLSSKMVPPAHQRLADEGPFTGMLRS